MSQNEGKIFEQYWRKSMPEDVFYLRIKDSATSFGHNSSSTRFTLSNPCDSLIFYDGFLIPMELKSTKSTSFSIQKSLDDSNKMIKFAQIQSLYKMSQFEKIISGFILDFRGSNTYWLSIFNFMNFFNVTDKRSINEKDVINYKGIKINKTLKRTRFSYDIESLLKNIIKEVRIDGKNNFL